MMTNEDPGDWEKVLTWLREKHPGFESNLILRDVPGLERGLVISTASKSEETLLHIPASSMLNPLTLLPNSTIPAHLFPQTKVTANTKSPSDTTSASDPSNRAKRAKPSPPRKLDTTQLLSLHVLLTKDPKGRYPSEWAPYLDSLPRSFRPWHPLTWLVKPEPSHQIEKSLETNGAINGVAQNVDSKRECERGWEWWNHLAEVGLSRSTRKKLDEVKKRFDDDCAVLIEVLTEEEPFKSDKLAEILGKEEVLWAWLNVNTRSISIPLGLSGPSERMNHTLVPIMDFINHSSDPSVITPRVRQLPTPSKGPTGRYVTRSIAPTSAAVGLTDKNGAKTVAGLTPSPSPTTPTPPLTSVSAPTSISPSVSASVTTPTPTSTSSALTSATSTTTSPTPKPTHLLRQAEKHLIPGKIDFRLVCPERGLKEGEEVMFEYGGHGSSTLFTEYGFCESPPVPPILPESENGSKVIGEDSDEVGDGNEDECRDEVEKDQTGWLGMRYGEVDVGSYVDELWAAQDAEEAEEKKGVLEAIGCWGGNTIHSQPSPAHPSHSLLMTLRVLHLPTHSPKMPSVERGLISYISPANENAMIASLEGICRNVIQDAGEREKVLRRIGKEVGTGSGTTANKSERRNSNDNGNGNGNDKNAGNKDEDVVEAHSVAEKKGVLGMLISMCEEERVISSRVLERLENGEEFS